METEASAKIATIKPSVASSFQAKLSDNDIVTEEHQNDLMFFRDVFRTGQFAIGDIAIAEIERMALSGVTVTHDRVFSAIGRFCGKSARTVRYYYETALFYPPLVRQEFNELPFSHFVLARENIRHWRKILEHSKSNLMMTEDDLRAYAQAAGWQRAYTPQELHDLATLPLNENGFNGQIEPDKSCEVSQDYRGEKITFHAALEEMQGFAARTRRFLEILPKLGLEEAKTAALIDVCLRPAVTMIEDEIRKMV